MSRRFTEKETSEILKRAIHLQSADRESDVTEGSLFDAAKEIGIQQAFVEQAIQEVDSSATDTTRGFWGGPLRFEREVIVKGELTDDVWESILEDLRSKLGEAGKTEKRGSTLEWIGTGGGVVMSTFTFKQNEDTVRIRAAVEQSGFAFIHYLTALLPMFLAPFLLLRLVSLPVWLELVLYTVAASSVFLLTRSIFSRNARSVQRAVESVLANAQASLGRPLDAPRFQGVAPSIADNQTTLQQEV